MPEAPRYCHRCGAAHTQTLCRRYRTDGIDWEAIMAYQVRPGVEMTLEQVGEVAGVSRERIRQVEFEALRKLSRRPSVRRAVTEALRQS